jgi:hypothetical protein
MASYTDIIPEFKPYVQQLPVEMMIAVGMEKQRRYDEGISKLQTQINNVAGLEVLRSQDKAYLQSKLNQLGNNLRTVAAGDFSDFQLVNSVGGMIGQIGKDKVIQAAVKSTVRDKQNLALIEEDRKKGTLSPHNETYYSKQRNAYLNAGLTDSQGNPVVFNGVYEPFFDVNKFARETFDSVKPEGYTFEQIYQTDSNGNMLMEDVIDPKTKKVVGQKPVLSPVMTRLEQEGRFPKTVRQTLEQIFSDGRVSRQLQISGEYIYGGYDPSSLKTRVAELANKKIAIYDSELAGLNIKKATGQDVQADIDKLITQKKKAELSYSELARLADTNPDAVRGVLYKDDVYDNFTSMYGTIKEKRTTHENPGWNQMFKMQQEENDNRRHAEQMKYNWASLKQRDQQHKDNMRMEIMKLSAKTQPQDTGIPSLAEMNTSMSLISMEEGMVTDRAVKFNDAVVDLVLQSGALSDSVNQTIRNFGGKISPQEAVRKVAEFNSKKLGMSPDEYTQWLYNKAVQEMARVGDANLTAPQKAAKISAENAYSAFRKVMDTRTEIDKRVGVNPMLELTRGLKTERVTIPGNRQLELTPQDQYDIAMVYEGSDWYESAEVKAEAKAAQQRLINKGFSKELISDLKMWVIEQSSATYQRMEGTGDRTAIAIKRLSEQVDKRENVLQMKNRAAVIKSFYQVNPVLERTVTTGDAETDRYRMANVGTLIGKYSRTGLQESPGFMDNVGVMMNIATGKEKGAISVVAKKDEVTGEITPKVVFTREDGSFGGEMTVTPAEASSIGSNVNQWWQSDNVRQAQIAINATGNGTTALSGMVDDPQTYIDNDVYYYKSDFANLRNMADDVKGNISMQNFVDSKTGQVSNIYFGHIFVNGANGRIYKPRALPPVGSLDEVIEQFNGLTPQMIEQFKIEAKNKK